ncbi:hypothetical protein [Micromonospora sp. CA-111912]|uniref:hypothetical protein n=1 Tax=Micromonospora sp. CA-111912 TaxID=3239955 RepID=UPI003D8AD23C
MLSAAPTCLLWWVARWTARMLTSLAVAVAFSLGAGSLSFDPAPPAGADAAGGSAAWSPADSPAVLGVPDPDLGRAWSPAGSPAVLGASDLGPVPAAGMRGAGPGRAAADVPAAPAHPGAVPAAPAGRSVIDPAPVHRMPVGPAARTAGSRAPPRG